MKVYGLEDESVFLQILKADDLNFVCFNYYIATLVARQPLNVTKLTKFIGSYVVLSLLHSLT